MSDDDDFERHADYMTQVIGATIGTDEECDTAPPEDLHQSAEEMAAWGILKTGPLAFIDFTYGQIHCGDLETLHAVIFSACLQSSINSRGLHPTVKGQKGSGKSSGIKAALHLLPPYKIKEGSLSPKAMIFMRVPSKTIFSVDDVEYNNEFNSLMKRAMTNFQSVTTHTTVIPSGRKGSKMDAVPATLNPRCVFICTSTHPMGDDQLLDRQLIFAGTCSDESYIAWEQERRLSGREEMPVNFYVSMCRQVMRIIYNHDFKVTHHRKIKFAFTNDRRLINQLYDLVEASAILHFMQREHTTDKKGIVHVTTDDADLDNALQFTMFQNASGSTEGRLTPAERRLDQIIVQSIPSSMDSIPYTEKEIAEIYGKSIQAIRKLLYGNKGNSRDIHGGLLEKTKWYLPDVDTVTHTNIILIKRHNIDYVVRFAEWI